MQKTPKGRDVEDDDSFDFNDGFTAPLYRIKVAISIALDIRDQINWSQSLICVLIPNTIASPLAVINACGGLVL